MLRLGFQYDQCRLRSSQWEGQVRMWWYEDRRVHILGDGVSNEYDDADVDT